MTDTTDEAREAALSAVLALFRDGDERGWEAEFSDLQSRHAETGYLDRLVESIRTEGIREPILLGSDGRVWDGHHRLCAASRLELETVPVEFASPRAVPPLTVDAVADWLGERPEAFNRTDYTDEQTTFITIAVEDLAAAVVAEFGPLTATREQIAKALWISDVSNEWGDTAPEIIDACEAVADALLASGVIADRAEVEREAAASALEDARELVASMERAFMTSEWGTVVRKLDVMKALNARAAAIREGGTP